jgi:hypothetical protein
VRLFNFLLIPAVVVLIFGLTKMCYVFRARAMRALAARWGFQYAGPRAPKWSTKTSPPLPGWFPTFQPSNRRITHVWNVIEGHQNGVSVLIFDSIIGGGKGSGYCTIVACQTEQNPFGMVASPVRLIQSHGWTVVHGVWFLWFSWTMSIKRVERNLEKLRVGSVCAPTC